MPEKRLMFQNIASNSLTFFSSECYFRSHWKIYCPGCGGTRALIALMQGKLVQSLKYNPIVFLFLLDVLLMKILYMTSKKNKKYSTAKLRMVINIAFLILIIAFFLLRNVMLYVLNIDVLGDFGLQ